jgi:hypothetical protein
MKYIAILLTTILLAGCAATDVVATNAYKSFVSMIEALPTGISQDTAFKGWSITSPDGDIFSWSFDFTLTNQPDLIIDIDAEPFILAGLDITQLDNALYAFDAVTNRIRYQAELGEDPLSEAGQTDGLKAFESIIKAYRSSIGYHDAMDHYGISLGDGHMLEWAKDLSTNDKDLVFILNPEPFIEAGVDPNLIEGWVYGEVEMMDEADKPYTVRKFLRPYQLAQ